jgi:hypothetical protein
MQIEGLVYSLYDIIEFIFRMNVFKLKLVIGVEKKYLYIQPIRVEEQPIMQK